MQIVIFINWKLNTRKYRLRLLSNIVNVNVRLHENIEEGNTFQMPHIIDYYQVNNRCPIISKSDVFSFSQLL